MALILSYEGEENTPIVVVSTMEQAKTHALSDVATWEIEGEVALREEDMGDGVFAVWVSFDGNEDDNGAYVVQPVKIDL